MTYDVAVKDYVAADMAGYADDTDDVAVAVAWQN
jgi:hypothetical protein